jgi:two-component system, NarL family, sensor histidine kinase DevS
MQTFSAQASTGLVYARTGREQELLAVVEDHERIAKELHDGVIQTLFAVGLGLQAAATISRDPQVEVRVEAALAELDRVIRDLRGGFELRSVPAEGTTVRVTTLNRSCSREVSCPDARSASPFASSSF